VKRALVVEDNAYEGELLESLLKQEGYVVTQTGLLTDALATAATRRFDLITLDLKLHDATPEQTMKMVSTLDSVSGNCPIVVISGHIDKLDHNASDLLAGIVGKPYNSDDVLRTVRYLTKSVCQKPATKINEEASCPKTH